MTALEKGKAEVQRIRAARVKLQEQLKAAAADLQQLESKIEHDTVESLIDGTDTSELLDSVTRARTRVQALRAAAGPLVDKERLALKAVNEAMAAELETEAAKVRDAYTKHAAKVEGLLEKLKELEGCPYAVANRPMSQGQGGDRVWIPKSVQLHGQLQSMLAQAGQLRTKKIVDSGRAFATSLSELLEVANHAHEVRPTVDELQDFYRDAEKSLEAARRDMPAQVANDVVIRIELCWTRGMIDTKKSTAVLFTESGEIAA